jgi:hypothetical protein
VAWRFEVQRRERRKTQKRIKTIWYVEIGFWDFSGAWCLEFGANSLSPQFFRPTVRPKPSHPSQSRLKRLFLTTSACKIMEIQTNRQRVLQNNYVTLSADLNPGLAWHNA